MIGVYKITNSINGKVYIGQSINIEERWRDHRADYLRSDVILYRAMRKYGLENFSFEVLEECSIEELDEKEIFYINEYNSYICSPNSQGYNMTLGGGGARGFTHKEDSKERISSTLKELYKDKENHPRYGMTHSEEAKRKIRESRKGKSYKDKKVICEEIEFNSLKECASYYNIPISSMCGWLKGLASMPQDFIDKGLHYLGEEVEYRPRKRPLKKEVICEGIIFPSATECAKYYGIKRRTMSAWLQGKNKMPQEFIDKNLKYI